MCKSQTLIKINEEIKKRSDKYYKNNPYMCIKHNFFIKCEVFLKYNKKVWPPLKQYEIMEFIKITNFPIKYLKNKNETYHN